jgi:DNA-binding NarL/FixJ family response regulator
MGAFDRVDEVGGSGVLQQEAAGTIAQRPVDVLVEREHAQDDDAGVLEARVGADAPGRLQAVHDGHPNVHEHHVRRGRADDFERFDAVGRLADHAQPRVRVDHGRKAFAQQAVVVDQHHAGGQVPHVDGITATRQLRSRPNAPEVIVLTTFDTDEHIVHALRAGASGFLLKDTPPAEIAAAVTRVAAGNPMLSPGVMRHLMERTVTHTDAYEHARTALAALTPREHDVAVAIANGRSNAEIATALLMSVTTVKSHVSSILTKLGLDNRTQIALLAHDADLV